MRLFSLCFFAYFSSFFANNFFPEYFFETQYNGFPFLYSCFKKRTCFKGRFVQGTDASSKGRALRPRHFVQGTLRPKNASSKGRFVQGTHRLRDGKSETFYSGTQVGDEITWHQISLNLYIFLPREVLAICSGKVCKDFNVFYC